MPMTASDVQAYRERMGWTQQQMASRCGVTVRAIRRWERNGAPETASKLMALLAEMVRP